MKSRFLPIRSASLCAATVTVTISTLLSSAAQAAPPTFAFAPGEVIVGVKSASDTSETAGKIEKIAGSIHGRQNRIKAYRVRLKKGLTVEQAVAQLKALPEVAYAEPNLVLHAYATPNDTHYLNHQWGPRKVQANLAWDLWKPQSQTVVAIVDTGVQMSHPDLANKMVSGYDIVNNDTDPSDDNGHGTHCAGIAAAQSNNGMGITGIAGWNGITAESDTTSTKIMPVKVLGADGSGTTTGVADGIIYAADNGAKVISLSLGGGGTTTLLNAVNYAYNKGCVIVAAAGNESTSSKSYPAGYTNVLSVASTDSTDTLSSFSNYGSWVKVAAPGSDIASTYTGSGYVYMSGTSMAAPLVAGQAALMRSQNPSLSNTQVEELIAGNTDPYSPYSGRTIGGGRVNVYRALLAATPATPTTSEPAPTEPTPTVVALAAPSSLSGQAVSGSQINLSWADNAGNEDGYTVERSTDGANFTVVATLGVDAKSWASTGLRKSTIYYYRVRAFNTAGSSAYSNTLKIRTARRY